jgi:RecJ-like exonuclease
MLHAGLGISICLGDRGESLFAGEEILAEYRQNLNKATQTVLEDFTRVTEDEHMIFVKADRIVNEDILGPVASLLSGSQRFTTRPLFIVTEGEEGTTRLSARSTRGCSFSLNLGKLLSDIAKEFECTGGGHQTAAGAMFPTSRLPEVLKRLKDGLSSS